jgi:hypothetical protein
MNDFFKKIESNLLKAGLNPDRDYYTIGAYKDDCRALWSDSTHWYVGTCERGKMLEDARFNSATRAAEYLAFLIIQPALENGRWTGFPEFDWS